jgi:hypothetical protein
MFPAPEIGVCEFNRKLSEWYHSESFFLLHAEKNDMVQLLHAAT